jgi:hypothetical protein
MTASTDQKNAANETNTELEQLGKQLASRDSIIHYARAFILGFISFIALGCSAKLLGDSIRLPKFFWPLLAVGLGSLVWGLLDVRVGRRMQITEHAEFAHYKELRVKAGIDK